MCENTLVLRNLILTDFIQNFFIVQDLTIDIVLTVTAVSTRTAAEVTVEAGLTKGRDAKEETKGGRRSGRKEKIGNREVIRKGKI